MANRNNKNTVTTSPDQAVVAVASPDQAVANLYESMPDFLRDKVGSARGQENVGADDLVIPRLEVVQDLSPCRKRNEPTYIEGAQEGMLYNNVTRELYGESVLVIPVGFVKEWLIWKDRNKGGGFRGAFPSLEAAEDALANLVDSDGRPESEDCAIVDTNQQFCLLVKPDGSAEEIVVSMAKSKAKVSRKWNSLIRLGNGDSFSRVYRLSAVEDVNNKNQKFYNFSVAAAGFPAESLYRRAEKMYEAISKGGVVAHRGEEEPAAGTADSGY
ncbi:MAG: hypothetical protein DDT26_00005 [Dehalococcoidia bacterium]|nr:hypothetical protein [Chloroflexota bacterium]